METGKDVVRAVDVLRAGGLVVLPTETSYGLAADVLNADALQRLFATKQRMPQEPVGIFVPSLQYVEEHFVLSDQERGLAQRYWPGAVNILLTPKAARPLATMQDRLAPGREKISVRISSHPVVQQLVHLFGGAVTSTSANISGAGDTYDAARIPGIFSHTDIGYVLDGGVLARTPASTVVEWKEKSFVIHRQGAVHIASL